MAAPASAISPPDDELPLAYRRAASFLRYSRNMPWNYALQQERHKEMLYRALNLGTSVAFLGAGCSFDFGLPDWESFAREAALLAWHCLSDIADATYPHRIRYKKKVVEFGVKLAIDAKTVLDIQERAFGWKVAEIEKLLDALEEKAKQDQKEDVERSEKPSGDQLRFILGACKQICNWSDSKTQPEKKDSFLEFLGKRFHKPLTQNEWDQRKDGVHRRLLALPFHRFITSNYDVILEQFLARNLGQPLVEKKFDQFLDEKAFTQADRNGEKLARFAAGMSESSRNMVFHCHGWHRDVNSMIVTEEDYQRWYLGDADGVGPAFRQTMELLVGSHPILFVGFGMKDPDLLMALRTLSATEPERKGQRSLFAVLSEREANDGNAMERLFDQYGVHVVGYNMRGKDRSRGLADFLGDLNQDWKIGRDSWLLKPKIHRVEVRPERDRPNEYWHYELKPFQQTGSGPSEIELQKITLRELAIPDVADQGQDGSPLRSRKSRSSCENLDDLVDKVHDRKEGGRLIVLVGSGGSGKSFCAAQLVKRLLKKGENKKNPYKCFFWSSYYSDDALTGIIRANEFFNRFAKKDQEKSDSKLSRMEVFAKHLEHFENILVFDGMERFLRPAKDRPDMAIAANGGVSDFLDILKKVSTKGTEYKATVVLTSRLAPMQLAEKDRRAEFFNVAPMTVNDAANLPEFRERSAGNQQALTALVALLDGHRYAVDLAALWPREELDGLIHFLGNVGPLRHLERMIELTLCRLDRAQGKTRSVLQDGLADYPQCDGRRPYQLLMKRLAVFMGPIKKETTFKYCCDLAEKEWVSIQLQDENLKSLGGFPDSQTMWRELIENKLLFDIERRPPEAQKSCVMHAVVREFVFHHFHQADAHKLVSFTQTGLTSGVNMVDPGNKGAGIIEELFLEIRCRCREEFSRWDPQRVGKRARNTPITEDEIENARSLCQEAFGVLRSRMLANTVPRWGSYTKYIQHLVRMGDLARAFCGMWQEVLLDGRKNSLELFWNHFDPALCADSKGLVIHRHGPLFDDELAWLYHELGLALYHEGAMIDCLAIWEQGLEVNKFLDGNLAGQYTFQSYCNLGAASIQYGRLPRAREYLQMAKEISLRTGNKDKDHIPRLNGYLALIRHLRGDLLLADDEYKTAIDNLAEFGNSRAECIFMRHRADLQLKMKNKEKAEQLIRSCRAKAEEGHFPDLVAHARLSEGHLLRTFRKYQDAIREYAIALKAAKQYGMCGLAADVYSEMAHLALDLGDTETARTRAIKSLQIANELHLGLRQTHGLVVLGKATAKAGHQSLGVEYLKQARELAERQHYELRAREAEEELHRLGAIESPNAPLQ